ncbi:tetratricopeptide repeat protein [uncultured Tenacibaculum sp.]|uniref:tetratricopeptide repeat protein n=1 Tax=uncultured Tenacibaculum sp. TaxID=174713 RepID=UPI00260B0C39|nr:tetratricopeptide repeat protein [uncultured Tenacibaculum sp.]
MNLKEKLDKIDSEIKIGLKFKAANRLRNLIQENPNEIELWNKLAELYYESGFLDSAGKYWILTEPTDQRIKKCVDIYEKSVNYSGYQILQEIVFRGDKSKLSEFAQNKLSELEADSKKKVDYIPKFRPKSNKQRQKKESSKRTFRDKLTIYPIIGVFVFLAICSIIGVITVLKWFF